MLEIKFKHLIKNLIKNRQKWKVYLSKESEKY